MGVTSIARMIPNATSYINEGYNPICFSEAYATAEKQAIRDMLTLLGNTFEVEESKLEAFAMISAMLPTYFWAQWKEIQKIGEHESHITEIYQSKLMGLFLNVMDPENQKLVKFYGISTIPTQVLLNAGGKQYYRHMGYISASELEKVIQ